jgi:hypothetical protein
MAISRKMAAIWVIAPCIDVSEILAVSVTTAMKT